jgi:ribosomal 30S subunit maturation factor RimM
MDRISPEEAPMGVDRSQVRVGLGVVGSDDEELGVIKEVRESDFLLARPMERDVYVPFSAIQVIVDSDKARIESALTRSS